MIESVNRLYFEEDEPSGEWVNIGGQYFSQGGATPIVNLEKESEVNAVR